MTVGSELVKADRSMPPPLSFPGWYESGWLRPLGELIVTLGSWVALLAVGLWTDQWLVRILLVVPLTLLSGQLFTIAHDAGHRSFSSSGPLNALAGRLALVPSVHGFALWRAHHDLHHRFTNLRAADFVWTPLTVHDYDALPRWRRVLQRVYRHASGLGLGAYYAVEIWMPRMLWPRRGAPVRHRIGVLIDTVVLYLLLIGLAMTAWWFVSIVDPERADDAGVWAGTFVVLFLLPLIGTQWFIGFVIFLNHTHPDIVWFDDPVEWSRRPVQLEGSAGVRFEGSRRLPLPRRIMNHTVHHLDPGVPLRNLEAAQTWLEAAHGDAVVSWPWSAQRFRDILARCKLYDYDTHEWLTYSDAEGRR